MQKNLLVSIIVIIIVLILIVVGFYAFNYFSQQKKEAVNITADILSNTTVTFPNPYDESKTDTIKFTNGKAILYDADKTKPRVYSVASTAIGDLDGDGKPEGVIGAYQGYGANIVRPVIFVLSDKNGTLTQLDSALPLAGTTDDKIDSLSINNSILTINLLVVSQQDMETLPHSEWTPTEPKTVNYKLSNGKLVVQDETLNWETYRNTDYGFEIKFPDSWKGFEVVKSTWEGNLIDGNKKYSGVLVILKNPSLASEYNFQGIPIMVITPDDWKLIDGGKVAVSAAPIGPSKVGQNAKYVFATPPRYIGFADSLSAQQNEQIQQIVKTFKAF